MVTDVDEVPKLLEEFTVCLLVCVCGRGEEESEVESTERRVDRGGE